MTDISRHHNDVKITQKRVTKKFTEESGLERELAAATLLGDQIPLARIVRIDRAKNALIFERFMYESGIDKDPCLRLCEIARILKKLHSISCANSNLEDARFPLQDFAGTLTAHVRNKYIHGLAKSGYSVPAENLLDLGLALTPKKFSYVHNDAKCRHCFFDKNNQLKGIIDFEYFGLFDPLVDIGSIAADVFESNPNEFKTYTRAFFGEYGLQERDKRSVLFYMITSKLTQALNIDLPSGKEKDAKKALQLVNTFSQMQNL